MAISAAPVVEPQSHEEHDMMEWVVERLIGLLGPIGTLSKDRRDLKDNALRSISNALLETQLYYRDLGRGHVRNIETETQLSR